MTVHDLSAEEFEEIVVRAVEGLPEQVKGWLDNVDIFVLDWPTPEQMEETGSESPYDMLGLYQGISLLDRSEYSMVLPDRIALFRRPIIAVCQTVQEVQEEVRITLLHEIAHYLGWSEEDMHRLGVE